MKRASCWTWVPDPLIPASPQQESEQDSNSERDTDSLIRMIANDAVGGLCRRHSFFFEPTSSYSGGFDCRIQSFAQLRQFFVRFQAVSVPFIFFSSGWHIT